MDINNLKCCIDHEEATIRSYMRDPEFAEYMLREYLAEGDVDGVIRTQRRIAEAQERLGYWPYSKLEAAMA